MCEGNLRTRIVRGGWVWLCSRRHSNGDRERLQVMVMGEIEPVKGAADVDEEFGDGELKFKVKIGARTFGKTT